MRLIRPGLIVLCLLAAALAEAKPASAAESIRIGYLGPLTGIFAQAGKDMLDGLKLSLEQINYQAGGRKIELIEEDTEGNSATAIAKYRKLVGHDKIHVLTGVLLVERGQQPGAAHREGPAPDAVPHHARTTSPSARSPSGSSAPTSPRARSCTRSATTRRRRSSTSGWRSIAMDNGFGHEEAGGFQRVFEDAGGRVVQKIWVPLNVLDFAPYLSQVAKDVDAVVRGVRGRPGGALREAVRRGRAQGQGPAHRHRRHDRRERAARHGRRGGRHHRHAPLEPHAARRRPTRPS